MVLFVRFLVFGVLFWLLNDIGARIGSETLFAPQSLRKEFICNLRACSVFKLAHMYLVQEQQGGPGTELEPEQNRF